MDELRIPEIVGMTAPAVERGWRMNPVAQIAFQLAVMRGLVWIGALAFCLRIGDPQIHRAPRDLIVAAVFMTAKTEIHPIIRLFQRLLIFASEIGHRVLQLMINVVIVAVGTSNVPLSM